MNEQDKDRLAAEYALGTLNAEEWARASRLAREDKAFARAVAEWNARLSPLAEATPEKAPPASLAARLEASLDSRANEAKAAASMPKVARLHHRLAIWRGLAVACALIAIVSLAAIGRYGLPGIESGLAERYVAMLHNDSGDMGYVVTVEPDQRRVLVRNMGVSAPPKKDFELWLMFPDGAEPLGLVRRDGSMTMSLPKKIQLAQLEKDARVVVCVEPEGGRPPDRQGMGPVVYSGDLVRQTP